jgi:hypothetical protein
MKFGSAISKVVAMCQNKEVDYDPEKDASASQRDGIVPLESGRDAPRHRNRTFPESTPSHPVPSHSQTTPSTVVDEPTATPDRPPIAVDIPVRPIRRTPTVELVENTAYHPLGGPDYLKILAKYDLFRKDKNNARIVCRFVNEGNATNRQPQIVQVEEFSAQGNQEFLAQVKIGTPPQGILAIQRNDSYCSVTA